MSLSCSQASEAHQRAVCQDDLSTEDAVAGEAMGTHGHSDASAQGQALPQQPLDCSPQVTASAWPRCRGDRLLGLDAGIPG